MWRPLGGRSYRRALITEYLLTDGSDLPITVGTAFVLHRPIDADACLTGPGGGSGSGDIEGVGGRGQGWEGEGAGRGRGAGKEGGRGRGQERGRKGVGGRRRNREGAGQGAGEGAGEGARGRDYCRRQDLQGRMAVFTPVPVGKG